MSEAVENDSADSGAGNWATRARELRLDALSHRQENEYGSEPHARLLPDTWRPPAHAPSLAFGPCGPKPERTLRALFRKDHGATFLYDGNRFLVEQPPPLIGSVAAEKRH